MRLSIFVGLLYVAWCIDPKSFDSLETSFPDLILMGIVFIFAILGDLKDLLKK